MPRAVNPTDKNKNRDLFKPMQASHVSRYFDHQYNQNEQNTVQTLQDEAIVISGYTVTYVFKTEYEIDEILQEYDYSKFAEAFDIAVTFPSNIMDWDNNNALMSKFGWTATPQGEFIISQKAWAQIMAERQAKNLYTFFKPREGDLIIVHAGQRYDGKKPNPYNAEDGDYKQQRFIFQITYTDAGLNNFQWGKDYVYRVSASSYKYQENEDFTELEDENGLPFLDTEEDFNYPEDQSDAFSNNEKKIRDFEENNPFKGY